MSATHDSRFPAALVTGVNGFVGRHLARHLASLHRRVIGLDIQETSDLPSIDYRQADIRDPDTLSRICGETRPEEIFHLAAISHPLQFSRNQFPSFQINLLGAVALLDAVRSKVPSARVLMVGSSKEYRSVEDPAPLSEHTPLDPSTFYGVSKCFAEMIGRRYAESFGLDIRYTRSFNHTGPGQSPEFVCSEWARQIAMIELGKAAPRLCVGNTDELIDFTDVRDIVEAYRLILEKGKKDEAYNVCSGKGVALKYILDYLIAKNPSAVPVIENRQGAEAHADRRELIGDNRKILKDTGWFPRIPFEKTLDDLYAWWIHELRKSS
jgi:GDP-4-dehydro-6-deoxy-D-mannose reductase